MPTAEPDHDRRFLRLEGVRNARDLGGYRTHDGRIVRWGRVYRTGALGDATARDIELLRALGLRVVCDLRSGPGACRRTDGHRPAAWTSGPSPKPRQSATPMRCCRSAW